MDIQDLNIGITLFNSKEQMEKFLGIQGVREQNRRKIFAFFEGIIWSKIVDGQYALYQSVLNAMEKYTKVFEIN